MPEEQNKHNWSQCGTFFSISFDLIVVSKMLPYDLYVNSSIREEKEKFVRVFRAGEEITESDILTYKSKYFRLYVAESQRGEYLNTIILSHGKTVTEKTSVLKDTAINYLEKIYKEENVTSDFLREQLGRCRDVVGNIVDLIKDYNVDEVKELIGNLSFHDFYTYDHSINVSMYSIILFRAIFPDADKDEIVTAGMGGLFHDLGKVKIPTDLLNWTGKLSDEQFAVIKTHPQLGYDLLKNTKLDYALGVDPLLVGRVVLEHHENFDGTGYPNKLNSDDIHILSKICAVADFFDAVTTKRSYQDPLPVADALALMSKYSGRKLDPMIFSAFINETVNFIPGKEPGIDLTEQFDPCQPQNSGCFCVVKKKKEDFGNIIFVGQSVEDFKRWAKNPRIKYWYFKKTS